MTTFVDVLSGLMLLSGCFLIFTGALGVLRFPDTLSRMHAAGVSETMATVLILGGLMLLAGWSLVLLKLVMVLLFLLFTSPAASHALAKAIWTRQQRGDGQ
ncbi:MULTISPECIES: monovalent cation/H(+) antiporter subunit G [Zhongshania]|jgi:multicomponent Na+:H+ antiporter subunit G|uniref:Monovalent cation/H(+) antiporter subunit G n=1 Tax=Zhongshania arctica TaxID=3238302 RepID=A0ABV3TT04_9GAMM